MRKFIVYSVIALIFIISLFGYQATESHAEEVEENLSVEVSTDKETYSVGDEIVYTIKITNLSGSLAKNIMITNTLPKGLDITSTNGEFTEGKLVIEADELEPFQSNEINFAAKVTNESALVPPIETDTEISIKDTDVSDANPKELDIEGAKRAPQTGDETNIGIYLVIFLVASVILIFSIRKLKANHIKKGAILVFALILVGTNFSKVEATNLVKMIDKVHTIIIEGKEIGIKTTIEVVMDIDTTLSLEVDRVLGTPELKWNEVEGATYKIKRGIDPLSLEILGEIESTTFSDIDGDLETSYYYQVVAMRDGKEIHQSTILLSKPGVDSDNDGLTDAQEITYQTEKDNTDTDGDGISDGDEIFVYLTDPLNDDTDGDRLKDGQEIQFSGLNPLKKDTDSNGVTDDQEDFDKDGLRTYEELNGAYQTDPKSKDTDLDNLIDSEEINKYSTNPTKEDTDDDGMLDGFEIQYGTNPNGGGDGNKKFTTNVEMKNQEKDPAIYPSIEMKIKGKYLGLVSISNVENGNAFLNEDTAGYIGPPYKFISPVDFDTAEIIFHISSKVMNNPLIEPAIYYFNEKTKMPELLPKQTIDKNNGTITTTVNHFSTYIVLNKKKVDEVWEKEMNPPHKEPIENVELAIGLTLDSSGSMGSNDRNDIRKRTAKDFINKLDENDKAAVIDFDSNAEVLCELQSDKEELKKCIDEIDSFGGTDLRDGMRAAIDELKNSTSQVKYIILLTDGQGSYNHNLTQEAIDLGIFVYTIGLGSGVDKTLLTEIAERTGGKYFFAETASDLTDSFNQASEETVDLATDTDKDGLSDYHEKQVIRTNVGEIKLTSENDMDGDGWLDGLEDNDTDGDGILDGDELKFIENEGNGYFLLTSNPLKKDSDNDNIPDGKDPNPMSYNITDKTLAIAASLSYVNLKDSIGDSISNLLKTGHDFDGKTNISQLKDWQVVDANNSGYNDLLFNLLPDFLEKIFSDEGLGTVAIKLPRSDKPDVIILGLRGTEFNDDPINDMLVTDLKGYLNRYTPQSDDGYREYKRLIKDNPNAEFYLAGHSLGGRLVQDVFYKIENRNESIFKTSIQSPVHAATFNALGYNVLNYKWLENDMLDTINDRLNNYYYKYDFVGAALGKYRIGENIRISPAKDKHGEAIKAKKYFGFVPLKVHGIKLWVNDNRLNYPETSHIN